MPRFFKEGFKEKLIKMYLNKTYADDRKDDSCTNAHQINREEMYKYYDEKITKNPNSAYEIFNIKNRPSNPIKVDGSFDATVGQWGYGEVKKGAFSQFDTANKTFTFDDFNYKVEVLHSSKITDVTVTEFGKSKDKSYYLVICQVS